MRDLCITYPEDMITALATLCRALYELMVILVRIQGVYNRAYKKDCIKGYKPQTATAIDIHAKLINPYLARTAQNLDGITLHTSHFSPVAAGDCHARQFHHLPSLKCNPHS